MLWSGVIRALEFFFWDVHQNVLKTKFSPSIIDKADQTLDSMITPTFNIKHSFSQNPWVPRNPGKLHPEFK